MTMISCRPLRVLLLGGTTEATAIATALAADPAFDATLSLAGRTAHPAVPSLPVRMGGFGGPDGLAAYLRAGKFESVVDATHPFAAQISANVVAACTSAGVALLAVERPPWQPEHGDHWTRFKSVADAIAAIGARPMAVFSGLGRSSLECLAAAPQHRYLVRVVDAPADTGYLQNATFISARAPFRVPEEIELFRKHGIELVLSKNSGGNAAYAKIEAARELGIGVFMVDRPPMPARQSVRTAPEAIAWLRSHLAVSAERGV